MPESPPTTGGRAVFLSYAHEDAEPARRIAEALRAAGLEVWFDQNELRGGDAWDQKIRRQIKECALFVPVISAHTQSRPEGYFRLEWKLAVDRSHLMADDQPFLVPVVIDGTPETAARVPERFRDVQWTRLVLTEAPVAFAARLRGLLAGEGGRDVAGFSAIGDRSMHPRAKATTSTMGWHWWMIFPLGGMIMGVAVIFRPEWIPGRSREPKPAKPLTVANAPTEARQLAGKASALYEPWDGASREDFALAEQMLKRAVELDPTDGEVWAVYGILKCGQIILGHDRTPAGMEIARTAAERATRLAPESVQARFAKAFYFRFQDTTLPEAERMLRELAERAPTDKLILRTLGSLLRNKRQHDEAIAWFERAAALPGGDPVALHNKAMVLWNAQRYAESEAVIDAALERFPTGYLYQGKGRALLLLRGDVAGAVEMLEKVPASFLAGDAGAYWASQIWLWRREPERARRTRWPIATRPR